MRPLVMDESSLKRPGFSVESCNGIRAAGQAAPHPASSWEPGFSVVSRCAHLADFLAAYNFAKPMNGSHIGMGSNSMRRHAVSN